jgi:hypothetical protein
LYTGDDEPVRGDENLVQCIEVFDHIVKAAGRLPRRPIVEREATAAEQGSNRLHAFGERAIVVSVARAPTAFRFHYTFHPSDRC